jgi:DNA-binding Lrp family transcriptional regulator
MQMDTNSKFRNVSGLDHIDRGIIEILSQRARISLKQLAGAVGLASPTVAERLKRLEERSYILGYTAVLDQRRLGYPLQALVRINPVPGSLHEVERMIQDTAAAPRWTDQGSRRMSPRRPACVSGRSGRASSWPVRSLPRVSA